ncbi:MAG: DUF6114 domain-containing protein [Thaumarchaeota archaeon]|nr:DUF6114 domain-containing protein [Nitrososphaerota archaeon]
MQNKSEYPGTASTLAIVGGALMMLSGLLILAFSFFSPFISSYFQNAHFVTSGNITRMIVNNSTTYTFTGNNHAFNGTFPFQTAIPAFVGGITAFVGGVGLVSGFVVIISGAMLRGGNPAQRTLWGVLIVIFSCLSFFGFGGFVVGAILGIVGGIMALTWKPHTTVT